MHVGLDGFRGPSSNDTQVEERNRPIRMTRDAERSCFT
jgi:hypothetical protein